MVEPRFKTVMGMVISARMGPPFEAVLADFEIESSEPRPQHHWWITERLTPHIKRRSANTHWHFRLTGMASHSGTDSYNMKLSARRANAVEERIRKALPGTVMSFEIKPDGETNASPAWEGAADRAVRVEAMAVYGGVPLPPPTPPIPLPPMPDDDDGIGGYGVLQRFRLQVLGYYVFNYKIGGYMRMTINIADELRKKHCYYRLNVGQLGISRGSPIDSHSNRDYAPPSNYFSTRGAKNMPLTTADFAGRVSLNKAYKDVVLILNGAATDYPTDIKNLKYTDTGWLSQDVYAAYAGEIHVLSGELGWDEYRDYMRQAGDP